MNAPSQNIVEKEIQQLNGSTDFLNKVAAIFALRKKVV